MGHFVARFAIRAGLSRRDIRMCELFFIRLPSGTDGSIWRSAMMLN
jgi:hypothetical protein